jgi:serine/threonine-protein kinase
MNSPETKKVEAPASGPIPSGTKPVVSGDKPNGSSGFDPGEALSSRFDFLKMVSVQGNAVFYHASDLLAGPRDALVVLKVFSGHAAGRQLELFQLEARSAAKLSHRNIIQASPPQELNGVHFCVLGHRFGAETLNNLINREGWLEPKLAIGIVHQIADALEYAHRNNVIHLRIQPGNILIDRDGTALLTDFGIDGRHDLGWAHSDRSSHLPLRYASPEQAGCGPLDSRSDLYSLGVVLYQMLTDRLPVNSEDADLVRQKNTAESPLPPHLFCPNIPLSLSAAVTCLLERDPARRFQDVAQLRVALEKSFNPLPDTKSPV